VKFLPRGQLFQRFRFDRGRDEIPARRDGFEQQPPGRLGLWRGVTGSPYFFTPDGRGFFCPSLDIEHVDGRLGISFDAEGFDRFVASVWYS